MSNNKQKHPKVSICMPTYNRAESLKLTIPTILNQTYSDFELIINDDASTDNTEEVVKSFDDPRIQYNRNDKNQYMPGNLNIAISRSRGEYIVFFHDHDLYEPELIEDMVILLDLNPDVGFVHPGVFDIDNAGVIIRSHVTNLPRVMNGRKMARRILGRWDCPVTALSMVRRTCFEDVGQAYDEQFGFLGDIDLWLRLSLKYNVGYLSKPLVGLQIREKNHPLSGVNWGSIKWLDRTHEINLKRFYANSPIRLSAALTWYSLRRIQLYLMSLLRCYYREQEDAREEGLMLFEADKSRILKLVSFFLTRIPLFQVLLRTTMGYVRRSSH